MEDSAEDMTTPAGTMKIVKQRCTQEKTVEEKIPETAHTNLETEIDAKIDKYALPLDTDILDTDRDLLRNVQPLSRRLRQFIEQS